MGKLLGTWGPKVGGVLLLIAGLFQAIGALIDGNAATVPNWEFVSLALGGSLVGLTARANLVTSESSGAYGEAVQEQAPIFEAEKAATAEAKSPSKIATQLAAAKK